VPFNYLAFKNSNLKLDHFTDMKFGLTEMLINSQELFIRVSLLKKTLRYVQKDKVLL